jgi:hypothetical protein
MNAIEQAIEALYEALSGIDGLRVVRGIGVRLDPPAAVVGPPQLVWEGMGSEPTDATFAVPVVVANTEYAMADLMVWAPLVAAAVDQVQDMVVRRAEPGSWPAGSGSDLPAYLITVEVAL